MLARNVVRYAKLLIKEAIHWRCTLWQRNISQVNALTHAVDISCPSSESLKASENIT